MAPGDVIMKSMCSAPSFNQHLRLTIGGSYRGAASFGLARDKNLCHHTALVLFGPIDTVT
ncbi:hypothetical protein L209DRAFT_758154 [Thermothelomyces heterothallicus CBS 203.75]